MLSFFRYFLTVAGLKGNTLKVYCLWRSYSQYPLTLKDISHGMQSKYQGLLISELLFPGVPWELSLQIMSFMGILGGVRVCSGWGFLNIKNMETKRNYLIPSLSQAWSNMATPHVDTFKVFKACAILVHITVYYGLHILIRILKVLNQVIFKFCWTFVAGKMFLYIHELCLNISISQTFDTPFCICMLNAEEAFIFGFWAPFQIISLCLYSLDSIFTH